MLFLFVVHVAIVIITFQGCDSVWISDLFTRVQAESEDGVYIAMGGCEVVWHSDLRLEYSLGTVTAALAAGSHEIFKVLVNVSLQSSAHLGLPN